MSLGGALAGGGAGGDLAAGGFAGGSSNPYAGILGANLVEAWDARAAVTPVGGGAQTWTGLARSTQYVAVAAGQRPIITLADATFANRQTLTVDIAAGRSMVASGLGSFLASGTRPYWFCFGRWVANGTDGSQRTVFGAGRPGLSDDARFWSTSTAVSSDQKSYFSGTDAADLTPNTTKHLFEGWSDGVNSYLYEDGVQVGIAAAVALGNTCSAVWFGTDASTVHYAEFTMAAHGWCLAVPSAAQRAALRAYGQTTWLMP